MKTMTYITASAAFKFVTGSEFVTQFFLDGTGKTINVHKNSKRGRYLLGLMAAKGRVQ